jgi:hypothetical protein
MRGAALRWQFTIRLPGNMATGNAEIQRMTKRQPSLCNGAAGECRMTKECPSTNSLPFGLRHSSPIHHSSLPKEKLH